MNYDPAMSRDELQALLERILAPLDACPVECDGFVRLASGVLNAYGIPYTVCQGSLEESDGTGIPLHFWLQCDGGNGAFLVIDYRARMWLGEEAPHGVGLSLPLSTADGFDYNVDGYRYTGQPVELSPITPTLFQILAGKPLTEVLDEGR